MISDFNPIPFSILKMPICCRCKVDKAQDCFKDKNKTCNDCCDKFKCPHKKSKYTCFECSPHLFCTSHGSARLRSNCPECNPGVFCDHGKKGTNRVKNKCPVCNPSVVCEHGNVKYYCGTCGKRKCPNHPDKYYYTCKECDGGAFCKEHPGEWKDICKYCESVTGRCKEHGRVKKNCIECNGCNICEHNFPRYICVKCKGTGVCEHDRQKASCGICRNGSAFCPHNLYKSMCIKCDPSLACIHCQFVHVGKSRYHPHCFNCYCVLHPDEEIPRQYKIKENHVRDYLQNEFKETITMVFDKRVEDGCSLRRPDVRLDFGTHSIDIECDENQHKWYNCETKRMMEIFQDCGHRPIVFLRFNPDSYEDDKRYRSCFTPTLAGLKVDEEEFGRRMEELCGRIEYYRHRIPEKEVTVEQFFYSKV